MGQRDKARALLLEALDRPLRSRSSTQLESRIRAQVRHRATVASLLAKNGFRLDAIEVQQSITMLDVSRLPTNSHVKTTIQTAADRGRQLVEEILRDEAEQVLQRLQTTLEQTQQPPDLAVFFCQFDAAPTTQRSVAAAAPVAAAPAKPSPSVSLLSGLLQYARKTQQLEKLAAATAAARSRFPAHLPLVALDAVIALQLGQLERATLDLKTIVHTIEQTPEAASEPAVWALAQAALTTEATRRQGQQLATAVASAAAKTGNTSRQAAALFALTTSRSASGQADDAVELLDRALPEGKISPESRYQLALRFAERKAHADAVRILAPLWREKPELLMPKLSELAPLYAEANRIDALVASFGQVQDMQLWQRYGHNIVNAAQRIGQQKEHLDDAVKLLRAAASIPQFNRKSYVWGALGSLLSQNDRRAEAWDAYRQAVFPPTGSTNGVSFPYAGQLIDLSQQLGKLAALETECEKAVARSPDWAASGDLLLAMAQLRQGNETPLTALAKKYRNDSDYAMSLNRSKLVLRTELAKCKSRPPLELARDLWLEEIERRRGRMQRSVDVELFDPLAQVYLKLGQRAKAREMWRASLDVEPPNYPSSYYFNATFQQRMRVAKLFSTHGFLMDSVQLYQQLLEMDLSEASNRSSSKSPQSKAQSEARDALRAAVQQVVANGLADAQLALDKELRQGTPPDLKLFFVLLPAAQRHGPPSAAATERARRGPRQLLPALLALARDQGKIDVLSKSVEQAQKRFPTHEMLSTLHALIQIERGDSAAAKSCVDRWTDRAARNLTLAQFGQALFLAQASVPDSALQASGKRLAKALLQCASQDDALSCYVTPLLSDLPGDSP
jgi:tetratricopeptide (TPR) repeat protein